MLPTVSNTVEPLISSFPHHHRNSLIHWDSHLQFRIHYQNPLEASINMEALRRASVHYIINLNLYFFIGSLFIFLHLYLFLFSLFPNIASRSFFYDFQYPKLNLVNVFASFCWIILNLWHWNCFWYLFDSLCYLFTQFFSLWCFRPILAFLFFKFLDFINIVINKCFTGVEI